MLPHVIDIRSTDDLCDLVHRAVQALAEGNLVAFPTETVYVIAASARHSKASVRLLEAQSSDSGRRVALAIKSADDALDYVPDITPLARRLARRCWPGPVTLVLHATHPESLVRNLPQSVREAIAPEGWIRLRVPAHAMILDVLRMFAGPLVITSVKTKANGDATTADEVIEALGDRVQLVLDDGPARFGQPSTVVNVEGNKFQIVSPGVVAEPMLKRLSSFIVVMVCTGNTCRSPMAEAICRKLIADRMGCNPNELNDKGIIVMSAGLSAMAGGRAVPEAVEVMRDAGIQLEEHESQLLTEQLVRQADLVLTMTRSHRDAILAHWPEAAERVQLLRRDRGDISDPIGGPIEVYRHCADQILGELKHCIDEMDIL